MKQRGKTEQIDDGTRRRITLEALESGNRSEVAAKYGIQRSRLYRWITDAGRDPEEAIREATEELEFRRRVRDIIGDLGDDTLEG